MTSKQEPMVFKSSVIMDAEKIETLRQTIKKQIDEGIVLLPHYIDLISPFNPQEPMIGWISVNERLPEVCETVIASSKGVVYPEARYVKKVKGYGWEWAYESGADYWQDLDDVAAWQPLPEPYRESED